MFYIAICDDDIVLCNHMEEQILEYFPKGEAQVDIFYTAEKLYSAVKSGAYFDLIFLDIVFETMDGVTLGRAIRDGMKNNYVQIIYISGKTEYAMELFSVRPMDFLVKPISKEALVSDLEKAVELIQQNKMYFEYKSGSGWIRIPYGEIRYFESNDKKIIIHNSGEPCVMYGILNKIEKGLPTNFIRVHQSYIVNKDYVRSWRREKIVLEGGIELPISRAHKKDVAAGFLKNER